MSREQSELSEERHLDSVLGSIDTTPDGYPGEREYELIHAEEVAAREQADAKAAKEAEEALLAEIENHG